MNFFAIFDIINKPLGVILKYCYMLFNNYGLSILMLTIITKALLIPLEIKRQKNTLHSLIFQPRVTEIQKKHGKDREKLASEMQKLTDEGYNPMGGCLPTLIQFPIIIGLYNVISHPLKYVSGLSDQIMSDMANRVKDVLPNVMQGTSPNQIVLVDAIKNNINGIRDLLPSKYIDLDFNMFGLNLAEIPTKLTSFLGFIPIPALTALAIIPILSGLTAYLTAIISQKYMVMSADPSNAQAKSMQKTMMLIMPAMSYFITMSVPAGVGLYWIMSNVIAAIQTVVLYKIYNPEEYLAKIKEEEEQKKKKKKLAAQKPQDNQEEKNET